MIYTQLWTKGDKIIDIKVLFSGFSENSGSWNEVMHTSSKWVVLRLLHPLYESLLKSISTKHHLFSYLALHTVKLPSNLNMFPRFIHMYELLRLLCMTWENYLQIEEGRSFKKAKIWSTSAKRWLRQALIMYFLFAGTSKWTVLQKKNNNKKPSTPIHSQHYTVSWSGVNNHRGGVNALPCHTWTGLI